MGDFRITTSDLSSLFSRSGLIATESLLNEFFASTRTTSNYPPYDLEALGNEEYRITIAVAGFSRDELEVSVENSTLLVKGTKASPKSDEKEKSEYPIVVHSGIAKRDFSRSFKLVDYLVVTDVKLSDGLLRINLKRELPEALKPKKLEIG